MTPARLSPGSADALLFDLGRVVIDIDFGKALACWAGHAGCEPARSCRRDFVRGEIYQRHETGRISDAEFFAALRTRSASTCPMPSCSKAGTRSSPAKCPASLPLLARAAKRLPLYAFSNTNQPHVEHFSKPMPIVLGHFREIFLSSTIGLRKPDAAAYDHVVKAIGVPAERIVFFDDLAENIEGARARGLDRRSRDIAR